MTNGGITGVTIGVIDAFADVVTICCVNDVASGAIIQVTIGVIIDVFIDVMLDVIIDVCAPCFMIGVIDPRSWIISAAQKVSSSRFQMIDSDHFLPRCGTPSF